MRRRTCGLLLSVVLPPAALFCSVTAATQPPQPPKPTGAPLPIPATTRTTPTPFHFDVEALTLKVKNAVVLDDQYRTERRFRPVVGLGKVAATNIRGGALRIDQNSTTNVWLGPAGTFGHRLHHRDVYVALMTLPIDTAGKSTFTGTEAFPLEFTVRLKSPQFTGFEKFKVGLLDVEAFKAVASVAVGRLPTPFPGAVAGGGFGGGGGGGSKQVDIASMVSDPEVILNRVEEPDIMGEIVLDHAPIGAGTIDAMDLTLRVDADGRIGGLVRISSGGQTRDINLTPKGDTEFFKRRASIPPNTRLSATVYVETLPKPAVLKVEPNQLGLRELHAAAAPKTLNLRIEGVGFGPDTRLEIVPEGATGAAAAPIRATGLKLERKEGAAEGATLLAEVPVEAMRARSYSIRITTGGQSAMLRRGVRVF